MPASMAPPKARAAPKKGGHVQIKNALDVALGRVSAGVHQGHVEAEGQGQQRGNREQAQGARLSFRRERTDLIGVAHEFSRVR